MEVTIRNVKMNTFRDWLINEDFIFREDKNGCFTIYALNYEKMCFVWPLLDSMRVMMGVPYHIHGMTEVMEEIDRLSIAGIL